MKTSKAIKAGQYEPAEVHRTTRRGGNEWRVKSKSTDNWHTVTKTSKGGFWCTCQARSRVCRHVTAVLKAEMPYDSIQVWTDEADAKRQHRKVYRLTRNGKLFWMTVVNAGFLPGVRFFQLSWDLKAVDVYYGDKGFRWERREDLNYNELLAEAHSRGWRDWQHGCYRRLPF